jgi:outer membrane protein assembly factor BamB
MILGIDRPCRLALVALWMAGWAAAANAQPPDLVAAAIRGDLEAVRSLVDRGAPVDTADRWGGTALAFAAAEGHVEVVRFLLERGADPSKRESFFDQSPLSRALGGGPFTEGLPPERLAIAVLLLRFGADDREQAVEVALERGNLELLGAAVASGPLYESMSSELRQRAASRGGEFHELLAAARSRPDPPPPRLGGDELERFAGRYEGRDAEAAVAVDRDGLRIDGLPASPWRVAPAAASTFRSEDGAVELRFSGRAGMVERVEVRAPSGRWELGRSVADPVPGAAARLADRGASASSPRPGASTVLPAAVATASWPGFRGPNGSGIAEDDGESAGNGVSVPIHWSLASGEGVRWTSEIPGLGNSSPIVARGRVFATTAVASGPSAGIRTGLTGAGTEVDEATEHRWLVLAFDARTGDKRWETEVGRGVPASRRHMKATQANSSPATDGQRIVVVFPTAGLAALDLDGRLLWKRELGPLRAGAFNDPTLEWGFASSPVIYGSTVILQVDLHEGGYLASWDLATGRELWRTTRDGVAPSWATPALWSTPDGVELVANASSIRGYRASDGRELWSLGPTSEQVVATPVVDGGILYVSSGYPPVKPIYAVKPGLRGEVEATPGESDERFLWSDARGGAYMPTPLVYRGLLYVVHHNARVVAYDASTGDAIWKARFSQGGTFTSSPVAVDGRIYTGTEEGQIYVFAAGPAYRELAVNDMGEPVMATPAIADGVLYVRTPSRLVALGRDGPPSSSAPR